MAKVAMLGTGFIGDFYTHSIHGQRNRDRVHIVYSRDESRGRLFAGKHNIPKWSASMKEAVSDPEVDLVVVGLPNNLHLDAVKLAAEAGKAIFCTKPLGRNADEAKQMLDMVERAGVMNGYLEDLVYTPKTLKALQAVKAGAVGQVTWARSRETHPGPHSDWFWTKDISGGGVLLDMGCHCIEISRNYIGKEIKPVEVMCWTDTLVKPIEAEDNALGWVKYENGAIGQFEVSWTFRGGMDLRDEVMGTDGTIWVNNFLRTGIEMFTAGGKKGYVAEKAETETGWIFPVGDEVVELGYTDMFTDMFNSFEEKRDPRETFYDGYIVNEIMDACYRSSESGKWEPVALNVWRGLEKAERIASLSDFDDDHILIKEEILPDGTRKLILKNKKTGKIIQSSTKESF
ncbi:MAG: Gfo/Idh/MocA family oxidoreductase [Bacteroidales bacterium]|jgi:predicted dehydrogenase|nr:Gfo/Idh/MocA family oxidoreductase [Bacteroidales bacterium]